MVSFRAPSIPPGHWSPWCQAGGCWVGLAGKPCPHPVFPRRAFRPHLSQSPALSPPRSGMMPFDRAAGAQSNGHTLKQKGLDLSRTGLGSSPSSAIAVGPGPKPLSWAQRGLSCCKQHKLQDGWGRKDTTVALQRCLAGAPNKAGYRIKDQEAVVARSRAAAGPLRQNLPESQMHVTSDF